VKAKEEEHRHNYSLQQDFYGSQLYKTNILKPEKSFKIALKNAKPRSNSVREVKSHTQLSSECPE
jgi:hypothetical protein